MPLQRKLTLFFVVIVMLPLAAAAFVVQNVVTGELEQRALLSIEPAIDATVTLYNDRTATVADSVRAKVFSADLLMLLDRERKRAIAAALSDEVRGAEGLDFLLVLNEEGDLLAYERSRPSFVAGFATPSARDVLGAERGAGPGFARTARIPINTPEGDRLGSAVGGFWLDEDLLLSSSRRTVQLAVVADRRVIATTEDVGEPVMMDPVFDDTFEVDVAGGGRGRAVELPGDMALVAWTPSGPIEAVSQRLLVPMLGFLLLALIVTAVLAYLLARLITQPLEELSEGARAISEGRFDHRIPVRSRDEVGHLAAAFNDMTERLAVTINELQSSRDQLQRAVRRVGETLRSTHDLKQIHDSILLTAMDAVGADAGTLWMFTSTRDELYPAIGSGVETDELDRLRVGDGVAGLVAERGIAILLPDPSGGPRPARGEPDLPVVIAIPLYSGERINGVLAIYRRDTSHQFTRENLETAIFLAEQGGVAIENVQLHEEAQRLSLTDGLTGVYNRRYYQMQFRQVLATAMRFERPFSVLMVDLDNFKEINDTYGHQRGDEILIEFSQRVNRTLREIDTFARYGGEEFICLLSETDVHGAMTTAEKVVDAIRMEPFDGAGEVPINLTVSIGVASFPDHGDSYRNLVEAADRAMYRAKQEGRDRVSVADKPSQTNLKLAT
ncbi:MAG: diguanylate cyclase [Actinomycetota bacterium]